MIARQNGELACDGVPLSAIAAAAGTPAYVYSGAMIDERYRALDAALSGLPHRLHYAIKANSTLAIVRRLRELGAGADANSAGELEVALRAGIAPSDIVCTGVGKTRAELERAIGLGVAAINVESPGEVDRIEHLAAALGTVARVAVRINPDIEAGSHPHISTGHRATKFGMSVADATRMLRDMSRRPWLKVAGLHLHIGSQITALDPFRRAAETLVAMAEALGDEGIRIEHLDLGGGLGISYEPNQPVVPVEEFANVVTEAMRGTGLTLLLEPGRWIVGPAGVLVTEVLDLKPRPNAGWFVVTDAGMTDLMRPALYNAWHQIEPVTPRDGEPIRADIVGPVCETSDTLGRDRALPPIVVGDLLAVRDVGAYGAVMASNYNRRPTAVEVLADNGQFQVVRRRQSVDDMFQWDV
ncbi:MAG TPA: diaminopimelate decarboxylase [Vicinamibacterales bacterium]|nr:diaminopimelate decarboxylase [Vicinamibacterales bacterium]